MKFDFCGPHRRHGHRRGVRALGHALDIGKPVGGLDTHRLDGVPGVEHVETPIEAVANLETWAGGQPSTPSASSVVSTAAGTARAYDATATYVPIVWSSELAFTDSL